ncbi:hypothetical protein MXM81_14425 [Serratia plymuthica]|uniref:hypothetical protein n=1 Tax=Serratia plymuthica TaxID=82996 RepID=UPI002DBFE931|nr:hypothetical protein [Serratia plymuthica]MEB6540277.1 hypothetical protein [Serratia plymuthica]
MSDKFNAILGLKGVIRYIDVTAPNEWMISELHRAIEIIENKNPHEEYKAAWLSLVNTIHSIDPEWLEKYSGESEWQKACDFIAEQNQELEKAQTIIDGLRHSWIGVDFAACVSDNIHRQILEDGLLRAGQHTHHISASHTHYQPVYFCDLLRSTAITQINEELAAAEKKHPTWPRDTVHASAILNEEAGELTQAAIDYHYHNGSLEKVRREAAQVGAMAIRVLIGLPYAERPEVPVVKVTGAHR